ncbi:MAG: hypothetical protein IH587_14590 [Anaerolineae bacterium]|nr:hypothetical protein [Anaerolineae bacterium]
MRLGIFIGGCGLLMVVLQPPGSPEFVLSVCSAALGGFLVAGVVVASRILKERD